MPDRAMPDQQSDAPSDPASRLVTHPEAAPGPGQSTTSEAAPGPGQSTVSAVVLEALRQVDERPLTEHPALYEAVHAELGRALDAIDDA